MAAGKITYRAKNDSTCPVCSAEFRREELLTGGGRMNAGDLTDELHRVYLPTQKYGEVHPLIYSVSVCPRCWYAAYPRHFENIDEGVVQVLSKSIGSRKNMLRPIFPELDFDGERSLKEGVASYVLAALCCEHMPAEMTPTFLRGLSFLRAGWLAKDLHAQEPEENHDRMAWIFLRKASFFYAEVLECEQNKTESIEEVPHHGPDLDNNFGYDGVMYLIGALLLKYGQRGDTARRISALSYARAAVSRIVGMGQSSKAKPSALLELGRALHKSIKKELDEISGET